MQEAAPLPDTPVVVEFDAQWPHYERAWRMFWPWQADWRNQLLRMAIGAGMVVYGARPGESNGYVGGLIAGLGIWAAVDAGRELLTARRLPARSWVANDLGRRRYRYRFDPDGVQTTTRTTRRYRWSDVKDLRADDQVVALRIEAPAAALAWLPRTALDSEQLARVQAWWVAGKDATPSEVLAAASPAPGPRVVPERWFPLLRFGVLAVCLLAAVVVVPRAWAAFSGLPGSSDVQACSLLDPQDVATATGRPVLSASLVALPPSVQAASACRWTLDGGGEVSITTADDAPALIAALAAQGMTVDDGSSAPGTSVRRVFQTDQGMTQLQLVGVGGDNAGAQTVAGALEGLVAGLQRG